MAGNIIVVLSIAGIMDQDKTVNGMRTKSKLLEILVTKMAVSIKVNSKIIIWIFIESILGLMVIVIRWSVNGVESVGIVFRNTLMII